MAEIKKVPAIRFKSDSQEWDEKTLLELSENGFTNGVFNDPTKLGGRYKLVNVLDMYIDSTIDEKRLNFVDIGEAEFAKKKVENGDVFFTRSSLVKEGIAHSNTYLGNSQDITFDGHLIRMRPKKDLINSCFLNYLLKTSHVRKQLVQRGKTATMTTIGQADIAPVSVIFPKSKDEQIQIGSYFQHLDKLISLHQAKVSKLTNLKKAMLEKMFPKQGADVPEIRFKGFAGAWDEKSLGDEVAEIVGGGTPNTFEPTYWNGDIDWYSPTEIGTKVFADGSVKKITELGLQNSSAKLLPANKTILFTSRAGIGDMAILRRIGATNQGFQSMVLKDGYDPYFIYSMGYLIKDYAIKYSSGSTFLEISGKILGRMVIKVPSLTEQEKIGTYFHKLDKTITLHQTELEKLNNLKKACLEKMFV